MKFKLFFMVYTFYCVLDAVFLLFSFHIGSVFSTNLLVKEEEEEEEEEKGSVFAMMI